VSGWLLSIAENVYRVQHSQILYWIDSWLCVERIGHEVNRPRILLVNVVPSCLASFHHASSLYAACSSGDSAENLFHIAQNFLPGGVARSSPSLFSGHGPLYEPTSKRHPSKL
jgi:hypothetical protein